MEMVRRLGLGVIGLGYFGRRHASVYSSLPHVRLVAVADVNADHGLDVAGRLGAAFHAEFDGLMARGDVDAGTGRAWVRERGGQNVGNWGWACALKKTHKQQAN